MVHWAGVSLPVSLTSYSVVGTAPSCHAAPQSALHSTIHASCTIEYVRETKEMQPAHSSVGSRGWNVSLQTLSRPAEQ